MGNKKSRAQRKQAQRDKLRRKRMFTMGGIVGLLLLSAALFFLLRPANTVETLANDTAVADGLPEVGTSVGLRAPNFELKNLEGELVRLSDYSGQPVALVFMHTY